MSVILSDVGTLSEYADALLIVSETALATTVGGSPSLAYETASQPAYDCCEGDGVLIVWVDALTEAATSPVAPSEAPARRFVYGQLILATYTVLSLRCAANPGPNGNPPSPAAMTAAAHVVQQDGWALWNAIRNAVEDGEIFEGCLGVHYDGGAPIREQGGCIGWEMVVRAHVPGIID